jgi:putative ABC transport system ATP-binding protein
MNLLKILSLKKYYGNDKNVLTKAIDDISFSVGNGEFVGIMGASGSGKTTLLNMIATIDKPDSGGIHIGDTDITAMSDKEIATFRGDNIGFVFQEYNLLNTLTVYENIALPLIMQKKSSDFIHEKVNGIATEYEIHMLLKKFPYEISGGQRQRAACARAVIKEPKIILADEPTGALDSKSKITLLETLHKMNTNLAATILMVTHDAVTASYCERILFLQDGKINSEILKNGKSRREFFGEILDILYQFGVEQGDDD